MAGPYEREDRVIAQAEIQRTSAALGVSPDVVEHDYVLGCYLHFLGQFPEVCNAWVFKGGTSLAKCHFAHYRFSEDLDFTLTEHLENGTLENVLHRTNVMTQFEVGIRLDIRPIIVDVA